MSRVSDTPLTNEQILLVVARNGWRPQLSLMTLRPMIAGDKHDAATFRMCSAPRTNPVHLLATSPRYANARAIRRQMLAWMAFEEFSGEAS